MEKGRRVGSCQISLIHYMPAKAAISTIQLTSFLFPEDVQTFPANWVSHSRAWASDYYMDYNYYSTRIFKQYTMCKKKKKKMWIIKMHITLCPHQHSNHIIPYHVESSVCGKKRMWIIKMGKER